MVRKVVAVVAVILICIRIIGSFFWIRCRSSIVTVGIAGTILACVVLLMKGSELLLLLPPHFRRGLVTLVLFQRDAEGNRRLPAVLYVTSRLSTRRRAAGPSGSRSGVDSERGAVYNSRGGRATGKQSGWRTSTSWSRQEESSTTRHSGRRTSKIFSKGVRWKRIRRAACLPDGLREELVRILREHNMQRFRSHSIDDVLSSKQTHINVSWDSTVTPSVRYPAVEVSRRRRVLKVRGHTGTVPCRMHSSLETAKDSIPK